jgi:hypothetical protein
MPVNFKVQIEEDENDPTAPYYELEAFDSIWDALRWENVRKRVPICLKKSLYNRYMIANLIYLGYTIALLIIDFHPDFVAQSDANSSTETSDSTLDQPVVINQYVNNIYIGKKFIYLNRIQSHL